MAINEDDNTNDPSPFHMASISEGNAASDGLSPLPTQKPRRHRRVGSHGGGGNHSRSESLVDSLAEVMEVLTVIDEVEAEPVSTHNDPTNVPTVRRRRGGHTRGESLVEGLFEEVRDVAEAFVEEMKEANDGDTFFLDMGLARGMSILPDDMVRVAEATAPEALHPEEEVGDDNKPNEVCDPEKKPLIEKPHDVDSVTATRAPIPLSAYILLATAVISLSSIGPLLNLQKGVNPILKIYWRMSATSMALIPFASVSLYNEGPPQTMTTSRVLTLFLTAACYATMCVGFVLALQYTAVGNAVILSNSQSILLLIGKIFVGQRILALEAGGAIFAFVGAALCSRDSAESSGDSGVSTTGHLTLYGDFLALVSATGGVFYLVFAKTVRPHISLYLFMFLIMLLGSNMLLLFILTATDIPATFDRNVTTGIWGWMTLQGDRLPLELTMVILCNLCGAMGYVRAMQHFDNLVISVAALLEPVVAELAAAALGGDKLPGTLGWIGNVMVAFGTFAVVYPSASSGKGGGGH